MVIITGCVFGEENLTSADASGNSENVQIPYSSLEIPWYSSLNSLGTGYTVGYYINPSITPISEVDFNALQKAGVTDAYVLVDDDNYQSVLSEAKIKAGVVGIRTNAWVFPGFSHASEVAQMKIGVLLDVETYDMPEYITEIRDMRAETAGVTFSLCVKPDGWDDNQYYDLIAPLCDHIVPMLYIGDYGQDINGLRKWTETYNVYNIIYPGKMVASLETYQSDQDLTLKNKSSIFAEIMAVKPYTKGVILFRYGLSNYHL